MQTERLAPKKRKTETTRKNPLKLTPQEEAEETTVPNPEAPAEPPDASLPGPGRDTGRSEDAVGSAAGAKTTGTTGVAGAATEASTRRRKAKGAS